MLLDYLKITDDPDEIREIAKRIVSELTVHLRSGVTRLFYTDFLMEKMLKEIASYAPELTLEERIELRWKFIYDYWVYGCAVDEEFYLHLKDMKHEEKKEYMVRQLRHIYVGHLNEEAGDDRVDQLEDKYRLYKRLAPYYMRDVIEVTSMDDYEVFEDFAKKHPVFVVKPADYAYGVGVHKASMEDYGYDYKAALEGILNEINTIHEKSPSRASKMVLEELIQQDESLAVLHPESVNGIRATAVRGKDGKIHIYHPWIKAGVGGTFVASAALDGFDAEVDSVTGEVITHGYQEDGSVYEVHPNSGITIKGFQIPKWDELVKLVDELMEEMHEYGYIGWDLVLTPKGWCVMEGNYSGEFSFQFINSRGYRYEFEDLIGWKPEHEFWWQSSGSFKHN